MVEIKLVVKSLKDALTLTKKALPKLVLQQERGHLLFKVTGQRLRVSATNNDAKAFYDIALLEPTEDISFTADPKVLEKVLAKIRVPSISLEYAPEEYLLKVYTTETKKSFTSLQSFPPEKMLTFTEDSIGTESDLHTIGKEDLLGALMFSLRYLAPLKEDKKQYDFVIINKGIVYAANGLNKMGFFVSPVFGKFLNVKIRKIMVPSLAKVLKETEGTLVEIYSTENELGIKDPSGVWSFSALKSNVESPKIVTDFIKTEDPFTKVNRNKLAAVLERVVASNTSNNGSALDICLSGKEGASTLTFSLISDLKSVEELSCERVKDPIEEDVSHVIEYGLFKAILDSVEGDDIKLYVNTEGKFFRIMSVVERNGAKCLMAGIGSYSKVVR